MKTHSRLLYILIICLLSFFATGCFIAPLKKKFNYYNLKSDSFKLKSDGIYTYGSEFKSVAVVKFNENGEVYFGFWTGQEFSPQEYLSFIERNREFVKNQRRPNNFQGFFYSVGNSLKIEILQGDPISGYRFVYYDGSIIDSNTFTINSIYEKKYHVQFSDRKIKKNAIIYTPPTVFRFKRF